jgi:heme/copper-type cytochrome/quinol oxidase subunit 2
MVTTWNSQIVPDKHNVCRICALQQVLHKEVIIIIIIVIIIIIIAITMMMTTTTTAATTNIRTGNLCNRKLFLTGYAWNFPLNFMIILRWCLLRLMVTLSSPPPPSSSSSKL